MTVTSEQVQTVKDADIANAVTIASVCNMTGCPFYLAVAMIERESRGRNVYGHDVGGALSGFPGSVNQGNFEVFRWLVIDKKKTSNGVGPAQLTWPGFFIEMEKRGLKPWWPADNIRYGVELLFSYYQHARDLGDGVRAAIRYAGTKYNGASTYGDGLLEGALRWKEKLGSADYA